VTIAQYITGQTENPHGLKWMDMPYVGPGSGFVGTTPTKPDIIATRNLPHAGPRPSHLKESPALWSEVHVSVTMKKATEAGRQAMRRSIEYTWEMFRDQPDRRFVIGLVISRRRYISIWVFDRTGGVGTELIDMHKACLLHLLFDG
jgi:hypothetical protein